MLSTPVLASLTLLVLVVFPYVAFERRYRRAWRKLATRRAVLKGGPYRRTVMGVDPPGRAPLVVRACALACFLLGGGCVPVATIGFSMLVGAQVWGLLVLVPAVVLARVWIAGARVLEPDVDALRSVRTAARWLVHLSLPCMIASLPLWLFVAVIESYREGAQLIVALGAASIVGLAHAALLARATNAAARLLPEDDERDVLVTLAIPSWMNRVLLKRRLVR